MSEKLKILYLISGTTAPGSSKKDNYFYCLSKYSCGDAIGMTWSNTLEAIEVDKKII